eukprot:5348680-Ditylum_brightwellii.AAC.1
MEPTPSKNEKLDNQDKDRVKEEKNSSFMDGKIASAQPIKDLDQLIITIMTVQNDKKKRKAPYSNNDMDTDSEREDVDSTNKKSMEVNKKNKNKDMLNNKMNSSQDDKGSKEENGVDTADYDLFSNKLIKRMKSICDKSPLILLKKIDTYHKDITIKIITKKELEKNLNLSLTENSRSAKDIKDMETELENVEEILQQIREDCAAVSIAYDNYSHYSK